MKPIYIALKSLLISLCYVGTMIAQDHGPSTENVQSRQWFENARFGLFIHWGVYSVLGDGEWVMNNRQIPIAAYEKLPDFFNPTEFDARSWVLLAKAAGMKYITITAKHHDGFALWNSKVSDYNVVERTPYKQDIIAQLAEECRHEGLKLFLYYSQLDWHHPDYFPRGNTGGDFTGRRNEGDWKKYLAYMNGQLTELLTAYGDIGGIWFDGMWDKKDADWGLDETYRLIHTQQPGALVGSNHHDNPIPGEDFQMFEKDLPGQNTSGFSPEQSVGRLPKETCETINHSWGFNIKDNSHKSTKELIQYLVKAAGYGANFLLNVGPMPNGKIQPEHQERLNEIGKWLAVNGESIYGTQEGPVAARDWGVTTQKGNRVFIHVLNWRDEALILPSWGKRIKKASLFPAKTKIQYVTNEFGVTLKIPQGIRDPIDTIVLLEME